VPSTAAIREVRFIGSYTKIASCPRGNLPEFAFVGRSNVGKSSLINLLVGHRQMAKTSGTPGKTLLLNFFKINELYYFVDLPGYGFARIPREERKRIQQMRERYLLDRQNLKCVFVLLDVRLPRQDADEKFMEWMATQRVPFVMVFTKADKCSVGERNKKIQDYKQQMMEQWEALPEIFITSSVTGTGRSEILQYIEQFIEAE